MKSKAWSKTKTNGKADGTSNGEGEARGGGPALPALPVLAGFGGAAGFRAFRDVAAPVARDEMAPGTSACDHCVGKCCRYFSLPIPTPRSRADYDEIRWYLAHGQTLVYVDEGTWHLMVMSPCRYLTADHRCGIYHDRPEICRDYENEACEYDDDWAFERLFESPDQIVEYAEALHPGRRR